MRNVGWLILLVLAGCGGNIELISTRPASEIAIDGDDADWLNDRMIIKDSKVALGFHNDDEFFYVSITPIDRRQAMHLMMMGMTIWFDPTMSEKKSFGIKFPLGFAAYGLTPMMVMPMGEGKRPKDDPFEGISKDFLNELEIFGPGPYDRVRLELKDLKNIAVKLKNSKDGVFYELKIPLKRTDDFPYGINASAGQTINVGIETGEMKVERPSGGGGFQLGGAGGGQMGGGGMQMHGEGSMIGDGPPKAIKLWTKVVLSQN